MTQSCRVVRAGSPSLWSLMELEVCRARTTVNPDYLARSVPSEFSHNILCQQSTSFKSSAAVYVLQDKTYSAMLQLRSLTPLDRNRHMVAVAIHGLMVWVTFLMNDF